MENAHSRLVLDKKLHYFDIYRHIQIKYCNCEEIVRRVRLAHYILDHEHFHCVRKVIGPDEPCDPHDHDCYELMLVEQGTVLHSVNAAEQVLKKGALVFVRPHDAHAVTMTSAGPGRILNVMFRTQTANHIGTRYSDEYRGRYFWASKKLPETNQLTGPRIERAINTALELQTAFRTLSRIEEFLLTVLTRVVDYEAPMDTRMPSWLKAACIAMQQPDALQEGTSAFLRIAGRGHEHVCRSTQKYLGITPSAYVNRRRMEYAAMMLAKDDGSVSDIAEACGIDNVSYFHRVFRAQYGTTPLKYRKVARRNPV